MLNDATTTPQEVPMDTFQQLADACRVSLNALRAAHLEADHRLAAGDTSDLLPGIDPAQAIRTSRRIIASDYHRNCPICEQVAEQDGAK